ncbi:MAG: DUF4271 domain-containing protein [Bacteroidetes bacterium]|nr:DUF4271 domain-containing protein [Bacteroidota bacterium]
MELAVIFKSFYIALILIFSIQLNAEVDSAYAQIDTSIRNKGIRFYSNLSQIQINEEIERQLKLVQEEMDRDSSQIDSLHIDTLVPTKFNGINRGIYINSKKKIRNSLLFSNNPPLRKNMNNWPIFLWSIFIFIIILIFKYSYRTQFYLISRASYSNLSFREFYDTQTDVFKGSKFLAWFIISQIFSLGVFIILKLSFKLPFTNDFLFAFYISIVVIFIFIVNQILKFLFSLAFQQPTLNKDYAIIFRTQAFIIAIILLPCLLLIYYTNNIDYQKLTGIFVLFFLLVIYASSLLKFTFSGLFSERQSSIFLILYLCAFEILPILVLVKSVNNLLFNG